MTWYDLSAIFPALPTHEVEKMRNKERYTLNLVRRSLSCRVFAVVILAIFLCSGPLGFCVCDLAAEDNCAAAQSTHSADVGDNDCCACPMCACGAQDAAPAVTVTLTMALDGAPHDLSDTFSMLEPPVLDRFIPPEIA